MLTLIGAWFVVTFVRTHWATAFQPYVRATVATLATMMGLVRSVPDRHICAPPSLAIHWSVPISVWSARCACAGGARATAA